MPSTTRHGQFQLGFVAQTQLKHSSVLIVHGARHLILTATLLQIVNRERKPHNQALTPYHCVFPLSATKSGLSH